MIYIKKGIPTICLIFSLILAVSSLYMPYWGVWNSRADELASNTTKSAYFMPSQNIITGDSKANISIVKPFSEIAENDTNESSLSSLFTVTLNISIAGMVLTVVALILSIFSTLKKKMLFHWTWIIGMIGALLLLLAPFYMVVQITPAFEKFTNVIPAEIGTVTGKQVASFWGGAQTWVWGAGSGWILLFVAALMGFVGSIMINIIKNVQEQQVKKFF